MLILPEYHSFSFRLPAQIHYQTWYKVFILEHINMEEVTDGEPLELAAQRYCGCPIPGSAQGQVGWGFDQRDLMKEGCYKMIFNLYSKKKPSMILEMYYG